jgi:hypothetical protein
MENLIESVKENAKDIANQINDMLYWSSWNDQHCDEYAIELDNIEIYFEAHSEIELLDRDEEANQDWERANVRISEIEIYENGKKTKNNEIFHAVADTLEANISADEIIF